MYVKTDYPVINMVETGRLIKWHLDRAGITVQSLQEYFWFEYPQAIYKWLEGESLPRIDNLFALARLLNVNMDDLLICETQELAH